MRTWRRFVLGLLGMFAAVAAAPLADSAERVRAFRAEPVARGFLRYDWPESDMRFVARSEREWTDLAGRLGLDLDRTRAVDFSRRMVVGIAFVSRNSGEGAAVTDALFAREGATVRWRYLRLSERDPRCAVLDVVTVPYLLASVPRTDAAVSFRQRRTLYSRCPR